MAPPKLALAHLPTPLWRNDALDAIVGCELWVKRDDMTAGAAAGNKIRKLEYLLADARAQGASAVITCGDFQSNHARATALLCRQLGMRPVLLLRSREEQPVPDRGNAFLDALAGAELRRISPAQYAQRAAVMRQCAAELEAAGERAYVIPEGGSNGLGALGYVDCIEEVAAQLSAAGAPARFDAVVHACGSGGTAAGVAIGLERRDLASRAIAIAVCDDRHYFARVIGRIAEEANAHLGGAHTLDRLEIEDGFKGPGYAVASPEQRRFIARVGRETGLVLDPVYTGKALFGLSQLKPRPRQALFIHTGGLPGLLAQSTELLADVEEASPSGD